MTVDWWTLGIQTVNIVILVWLLARFFWRPLAAMIEQRRASVDQTLAEAKAKRDEAAAARVGIEKTRAGFAAERDAILASARKAAEQARADVMKAAATAAAVLEAAAKATIETEKAASGKAWADRSGQLAVDMAGRLAARLDGSTIRATFLDWLLAEIRTLPDSTRQSVAANGMVLEAVSATPIEPANQERYRTLIGEAFGAHPQIAFSADPALLAGLELRGPHFTVSNSWRADLAKLHADLQT